MWGWRIPFLLAFLTALLGALLRAGLGRAVARWWAVEGGAPARAGATGGGGQASACECHRRALCYISLILPGFWLRRGMPEPRAFLEAARRERLHSCRAFTRRQLSLARGWQPPPPPGEDLEQAGGKR